MNSTTIVRIRCDASPSLGFGHVRRCLVLAEELRKLGIGTEFVTKTPEYICPEVASNEILVLPLDEGWSDEEEARTLAELGGIFVIDLLGVSENYQQALHAAGLSFAVVDGSQVTPCWGRWLIDPFPIEAPQNFEQNLRRRKETSYLGGPDYAIYRSGGDLVTSKKENRIVISMGGGDDRGSIQCILDGLSGVITPLEILVFTGANNPSLEAIRAQARKIQLHEVAVLVDQPLLQKETGKAYLGFAAGGVTCYEMASMGLALFLVPIVGHQSNHARAWEELGVGTFLGPLSDTSPALIEGNVRFWLDNPEKVHAISSSSRRRFVGGGGRRIAETLRDAG